jgi:hypothetical protein
MTQIQYAYEAIKVFSVLAIEDIKVYLLIQLPKTFVIEPPSEYGSTRSNE